LGQQLQTRGFFDLFCRDLERAGPNTTLEPTPTAP
jgi:hypothetical protein